MYYYEIHSDGGIFLVSINIAKVSETYRPVIKKCDIDKDGMISGRELFPAAEKLAKSLGEEVNFKSGAVYYLKKVLGEKAFCFGEQTKPLVFGGLREYDRLYMHGGFPDLLINDNHVSLEELKSYKNPVDIQDVFRMLLANNWRTYFFVRSLENEGIIFNDFQISRQDIEAFFSGIKKDGTVLNPRLKSKISNIELVLPDDRKLILDRVSLQDGFIFRYTSRALRSDRDFVLEAIEKEAGVIQYVGESLRNDREFVMQAYNINRGILPWIDVDLWDDPKIKALFDDSEGVFFENSVVYSCNKADYGKNLHYNLGDYLVQVSGFSTRGYGVIDNKINVVDKYGNSTKVFVDNMSDAFIVVGDSFYIVPSDDLADMTRITNGYKSQKINAIKSFFSEKISKEEYNEMLLLRRQDGSSVIKGSFRWKITQHLSK